MAFIYVVRCEDESLYTGITRNINERMADHFYRTPRAAKYTRAHHIKALEGVWETDDISLAARFEAAFKKMPKDMKESVLKSPNTAISACNLMAGGKLDEKAYRTVVGLTLEKCLEQTAVPKDAKVIIDKEKSIQKEGEEA